MSKKGKLVALCAVWLVIALIGFGSYRLLVRPKIEQAQEEAQKQRILTGSSESAYDYRLNLALDSFSGYAVLRSSKFADELAQKSIKLTLIDDGANYAKRIADLKSGKTQIAAFTIDALLKASAEVGDLPASIVAIIDETRGADAMLGFKSKFGSVDDLNRRDVRFVLFPNSPSETLARVVMAQFQLPELVEDPFVRAKDAADVFRRYENAGPDDNFVFVLWEPYVSKMMADPAIHTIISSRDLFGYIVDVLVVSRDYLRTHESVVRDIVECYFRAVYTHRPDMRRLVSEDARNLGESLSEEQAERLVNGMQWKDTQRNYAHFGITQSQSVQHIEDMIDNISRVLIATSAIDSDPTGGQPNLLYYDAILRKLEAEKFHPAGSAQGIDDTVQLRALTDEEWRTLSPIGTLNVPQLVFARGTARLLSRSQSTLNELADLLTTQRYYVRIHGVATRQGNHELNKKLASDRARAAVGYLIDRGIAAARVRAAEPELGDVPSVTFSLGQLPY